MFYMPNVQLDVILGNYNDFVFVYPTLTLQGIDDRGNSFMI